MYAAYFGLKQEPFSIAPDPRLLFMSERHREALAHLLYGVGSVRDAASGAGGGFVLLTGEIGTGKTTICQLFLEQVPAHCNVAYIFNPKLTVTELLQSICEEFHIPLPQPGRAVTVKDYLDPLNAFLLREHAAGRNNVLVIDEAQNLSADVLEQLRLLTNLETRERKLLQIVLIGQPELRAMLARPELEQLAQRVIARYHLDALAGAETAQYVQHRLEAAGLTRPLPFDRRALQRIHQLTRGVPRRINLLCDRALLGAFAGGRAEVDRAIVDRAASEVFDRPAPAARTWPRIAAVLALAVAAGAGFWAIASQQQAAGRRAASAAKIPPGVSGPVAAPAPVAPVVAAAAPAPRAATVSASAAPSLLSDEGQAWRELAKAWQQTPGEGDPCRALQREQVQCFSREMNLALIRQLGRPGIVTLDARSGRPSYALLTALTADSATLRAGDSEQTVTLPALAARWRGEFATLWRAPPGYGGRIGDGESGAALSWLTTQLAALDGVAPTSGPPKFDAAMKSRVLAFQLAQGLPADGRPGPMTFMQLNRAAGVDEPRLQTAP
ncbi:MAG: Peptidoglycan-binding domain 1 [Ramlibacter sp.]|nr:Peptidoglycan-binding domain 1 [Ramlibacter sp.]